MYSKLSTQAIVLKTEDVGEKDVFLSLFTREFGFIYAKATGVRTQNSRLRFTLQTMTLCYVSLVHGKTNWILTNATFIHSYYFDTDSVVQKNTLIHIIHLLGRLYIGEESHVYLFDFIQEHLDVISKTELSTQDTKGYEIFTVFKLLEKLGYIEDHAHIKPLLESETCNPDLIQYIFDNKKIIAPFINNAIRTSGL